MEAHEELLTWAEAQGIEMNGIRPDRIPGRGVGIIATRKLKAGETLLRVPTTALRTMFTVPKSIVRKLPSAMSVHGLLAADLALDRSGKYDEWNAVVPTEQDLEGMPFTWPAALQEHLPLRARELLRKQEAKFARDWTPVSAAFPKLTEEAYRHAWLLANTRTFYFVTPATEKLAREDRMVLQPVADLFNHSDRGCDVAFSDDDFSICSDRPYAAGDEIFICYGNHSNDFLMAEYGFVLASGANRFDEVCIDDALLPHLTAAQKTLLAEHDFLGNYMLDAETVCFRTEVAVRLMSSPSRAAWLAFVEGLDDGTKAQEQQRLQDRADRKLRVLLDKYRRRIRRTISLLEDYEDEAEGEGEGEDDEKEEGAAAEFGTEGQRTLLVTRWRQIDLLVLAAIERLSDPE